jgi:hypothetical protein
MPLFRIASWMFSKLFQIGRTKTPELIERLKIDGISF